MGHSSPDTDNLRCTVHASIVRFWYRGSRLDVTRSAVFAVEKFVGPKSRDPSPEAKGGFAQKEGQID